jgi:hypothetical protein
VAATRRSGSTPTATLDRRLSGQVFFEQVIRDNLDIGRPDQVSLISDRELRRGGNASPRPAPHPRDHTRRRPEPARRLQTRHDQAAPQGKPGPAHRDHHQRDPRLRHREAADQPAALRQVRFKANRRLLDVQTISHDPIDGHHAPTAITGPVIATGLDDLTCTDDEPPALRKAANAYDTGLGQLIHRAGLVA